MFIFIGKERKNDQILFISPLLETPHQYSGFFIIRVFSKKRMSVNHVTDFARYKRLAMEVPPRLLE